MAAVLLGASVGRGEVGGHMLRGSATVVVLHPVRSSAAGWLGAAAACCPVGGGGAAVVGARGRGGSGAGVEWVRGGKGDLAREREGGIGRRGIQLDTIAMAHHPLVRH